jgi:mono/diheme cytochrome c family protein
VKSSRKLARVVIALVVVAALGAGAGGFVWYKFFREEPEPPFVSDEQRFKYGSIGTEHDAGIPYWILLVLPRMFPEYLPGPGGYRAFGLAWEEGAELPVGFTKRTIGFPRVGNNCAVCHAATYRRQEAETPKVVAAGAGHSSNVQALLRFFARCANDPRFNSSEILGQIALIYDLGWVDKLLYRFVIIPFTKKALIEQGEQFAWMNRPGWTDWGPGRTDPMNLTKYFMTKLPVDDTIGNADMPAIWHLRVRDGKALQWDGSTPLTLAVVTDSALGMRARNTAAFREQMRGLEAWLRAVPAPRFPFEVDTRLAAAGKTIFDRRCATCHASGNGSRLGTLIDIAEIGTDRSRLDSWTQEGADAANRVRSELGVNYANMVKTNGYIAVPLDGLWLRGPYLHNGSVPTVRDLLEPPERRPVAFYRGHDVLDPVKLGFKQPDEDTVRKGMVVRYDTRQRANGNGGHLYGTTLSAAEKDALIEYLKTL